MARKSASKKDYDNIINIINNFKIDIINNNNYLNINIFNKNIINNELIINVKDLNIDYLNQYLEMDYNNPLMQINYNKYKDSIIASLYCKAKEALQAWQESPEGMVWIKDYINSHITNMAVNFQKSRLQKQKEEQERVLLLNKINNDAEGWDSQAFVNEFFGREDSQNQERFMAWDVNTNIYNISVDKLNLLIDNILLSINNKEILKQILKICFKARDLSFNKIKFQNYNFIKLNEAYKILKANNLQ